MSKRILKAKEQRKECVFTAKKSNKNSVTSELCDCSGSKILVFTINYCDEKYLEKQKKVMMNYSVQEAF